VFYVNLLPVFFVNLLPVFYVNLLPVFYYYLLLLFYVNLLPVFYYYLLLLFYVLLCSMTKINGNLLGKKENLSTTSTFFVAMLSTYNSLVQCCPLTTVWCNAAVNICLFHVHLQQSAWWSVL